MRKLCLLVCTCLLADACNDPLEEEKTPETRASNYGSYFNYVGLSHPKMLAAELAINHLLFHSGVYLESLQLALYRHGPTLTENPSLIRDGAYSPYNGRIIYIKDVNGLLSIGRNYILQHEVFHFYQDVFYDSLGGLSFFETKGRLNVEFEASFFTDYCMFCSSGGTSSRTVGWNHVEELALIMEGLTESKLLANYNRLFQWFALNSEYAEGTPTPLINVAAFVDCVTLPY